VSLAQLSLLSGGMKYEEYNRVWISPCKEDIKDIKQQSPVIICGSGFGLH